jgi:hypothetical protein
MDPPDLGRRNSTCSTSTQRTFKSLGLGVFAKLVTEDGDDVKTEEKRSDFYYDSGLVYDNAAGQDVLVIFCARHATMVALMVRL